MKIDMLPILKGEKKELAFDYPLTIEAGFSSVVFPEPVRVLGTIRDMAGYIALALTVTIPYETVCDRCLAPISRTMELEFNKTVALEDTLENEDNDDYVIVHNRMLDLDEALQEAVVLSFPTKHLCKDDCKGLCAICGKDLNEGLCDCVTTESNPMWDEIRKKLGNK